MTLQPGTVRAPRPPGVRFAPQRRLALLLALAMALAAAPALSQADLHSRLRAAAGQGDLAAFRALLAAGADVNAKDTQQDSAFLIAARNGHAELVRAALAAGADVKSLNRYGSTALMGPAYRGHVEVVRVLLDTDIDLAHVNHLGWTALLEAIVLGTDGPRHREIVRLLVERGSNVNQPDREGVRPLAHAQRRGQAEVVRLLRAAGAR